MPIIKCHCCGLDYVVPNYRIKSSRFCSKACHGRHTAKIRVFTGAHAIGNKWRVGIPPASKGKPSPSRGRRFVDYVSHVCNDCGSVFERVPWIDKQSKGDKLGKFCNSKCRNNYISKNKSGENSHLYVGGINTYRGRGWKKIRMLVVARDGGECQKCKKFIGDSISVHHIKPYRLFKSKEEANQLANLVCVCQSCHMKEEWDFLRNQKFLAASNH